MANQSYAAELLYLGLIFPPLDLPMVIKIPNNKTPSNIQAKAQISQGLNPLLVNLDQENLQVSSFILRKLLKMELRLAKEVSWGN
jgi:hypothetical protein